MKIKTSISISDDVLAAVDRHAESNNRSVFIEYAIREYLRQLEFARINAKDLQIINKRAARLNKEAMDALEFQADT